MLENVKAVNNPLTIIAIFAALAEIAGTIALATVNKDLQPTFVWFVMGFPVLLVVLFFLTLNFNPKVLYAPSDFRDEENFLNTLVGSRTVSIGLEEVTSQIEEAKGEILKQAVQEITQVGAAERSKLSDILDRQLETIEQRINSVRRTADAVVSGENPLMLPINRIMFLLSSDPMPRTLVEIATVLGVPVDKAEVALKSLMQQNCVRVLEEHPGVLRYGLT